MPPLARRNLLADPLRTLLSVWGVAVAILLILLLVSLYAGVVAQFTAWVDNLDADLIVTAGTDNAVRGASRLPAARLEEIRRLDGVATAQGIQTKIGALTLNDKQNTIYFVGVGADGAGGPWRMEEGARIPQAGEIVVDSVFARSFGLKLGDTLKIGRQELRIAGYSAETHTGYFYLFVGPDQAANLFAAPDTFTNILIRLRAPAEADRLRQEIERTWPGTTVFTRQAYAGNTLKVLEVGSLPPLRIIVGLGFLIGTAIVGLTIYTTVLERVREYAMLIAMGGTARHLFRLVLVQSLLVGLAGFAAGALGAFAVGALVSRLTPRISAQLDPLPVLLALLLAMLMATFGAILPSWRVVRTDPSVVFRS